MMQAMTNGFWNAPNNYVEDLSCQVNNTRDGSSVSTDNSKQTQAQGTQHKGTVLLTHTTQHKDGSSVILFL